LQSYSIAEEKSTQYIYYVENALYVFLSTHFFTMQGSFYYRAYRTLPSFLRINKLNMQFLKELAKFRIWLAVCNNDVNFIKIANLIKSFCTELPAVTE